MRVASLGSGSKGNSTVIEGREGRLLLDLGFGLKETIRRLARLDLTPMDIDAVLVTHEHNLANRCGQRLTLAAGRQVSQTGAQ